MEYVSTRLSRHKVSAAQAIVSGIAPDGGLYMPCEFPKISYSELKEMLSMDYPTRSAKVLSKFLDDFSYQELLEYTKRAYSSERFGSEDTAPVVHLSNGENILELFHGPTCAFKDFALQMLPLLMTASLKKTGETRRVMILVATSGDTGKAALEGFADVEGTSICVFYPDGGVSNMQRLQMATQRGENVKVSAVHGNFDDAQSGVKAIFTDQEFSEELSERGYLLSSANSINWGRLAPQISYYFSAYLDMVKAGRVEFGQAVNFCVPTGNFGNILAAYYAKKCGLPVGKLICASNRNSVLTDFIHTGCYDRNRPFYLTSSPSMDILISSNLERLLADILGSEAEVNRLMAELKLTGRYEISIEAHKKLIDSFDCGTADDVATAAAIRRTFEDTGYLADTHTAVAIDVYEDYVRRTGDSTPGVIVSTASPFKFPHSVLEALGKKPCESDFDMLKSLSDISGMEVPKRLAELKGMEPRFNGVVEPEEMKAMVADFAK